jgi:hypothetical protein
MSEVVSYKKVTSADEAFEVVSKKITPDKIEQFKVKAELDYDKEGKKITASGKGFDLYINFSETELTLDLKLSLVLRPLKGKVLATISKQLANVI